MYTLEQKVGQSVLRTIPIDFCLTVPAIWSEVAKEKTLKACEKAGLKSNSKILLVSEPEAAAIYSLHCLHPHGLNVGDSFVLCDAGGGTVDLISYTITDLYPMLKVKEAAAGTGGLCGSTFLNRRFGEYLESKLGKEPGWDGEVLAEAMDRFDSAVCNPIVRFQLSLYPRWTYSNSIQDQKAVLARIYPGKLQYPCTRSSQQ